MIFKINDYQILIYHLKIYRSYISVLGGITFQLTFWARAQNFLSSMRNYLSIAFQDNH